MSEGSYDKERENLPDDDVSRWHISEDVWEKIVSGLVLALIVGGSIAAGLGSAVLEDDCKAGDQSACEEWLEEMERDDRRSSLGG